MTSSPLFHLVPWPCMPCGKHRFMRRAFSLMELLSVVAVVALLLALIAPAISGWGGVIGRKAAVAQMLTLFEQARAAAIETGQTVHVAIANDSHPDPSMRYAAILVFRSATEEEQAADPGREFFILKNWTRLPRRTAFRSEFSGPGQSLIQAEVSIPGINRELPAPARLTIERLPLVRFNGAGAIEGAIGPLFLFEGYHEGGRDMAAGASVGQETILFSRFTGRAYQDIGGI